QGAPDPRTRREGAQPVVEQAHLDAIASAGTQRIHELLTGPVALEDVRLEVDVSASTGDRLEPGREVLRSVLKHADPVAGDGRGARAARPGRGRAPLAPRPARGRRPRLGRGWGPGPPPPLHFIEPRRQVNTPEGPASSFAEQRASPEEPRSVGSQEPRSALGAE